MIPSSFTLKLKVFDEKPDACGGAGGFACQPAGRPATFFNASWFFAPVAG
jgi:hypothetical protein